jgi:hypothetical protein
MTGLTGLGRLWSAGLAFLLWGCQRDEARQQYSIEGRTVGRIINLLQLHDAKPGTPVTNLAQAFADLDVDYPHTWHRQFKAFGKHAGFTNSFFEKYIFFPPGITNYWIDGELLFMNAKPYPGPRGEVMRTVISKGGKVYYHQVFLEERVQQIFKEASIAIPKVTPMPAVPAPPEAKRVWEVSRPETREFPLWVRMQLGIMDLCQWLGVNPSWAYWIQWALIALVVLLVGIALVQLGRRLLRRS